MVVVAAVHAPGFSTSSQGQEGLWQGHRQHHYRPGPWARFCVNQLCETETGAGREVDFLSPAILFFRGQISPGDKYQMAGAREPARRGAGAVLAGPPLPELLCLGLAGWTQPRPLGAERGALPFRVNRTLLRDYSLRSTKVCG